MENEGERQGAKREENLHLWIKMSMLDRREMDNLFPSKIKNKSNGFCSNGVS